MMRIIAGRMNAAADRAWRSKSRARRRLWLIQASVLKHQEAMRFIALDDRQFQVPVLSRAAAVFGPGTRHKRRYTG